MFPINPSYGNATEVDLTSLRNEINNKLIEKATYQYVDAQIVSVNAALDAQIVSVNTALDAQIVSVNTALDTKA